MSKGIELVRDRRVAIRGEREALAQALRALDEEEANLKITEETLMRLERSVGTERKGQETTRRTPSRKRVSKTGSPRPPGLPTTREMIDAVLETAERAGRRGLSGKGIVELIDSQFWPGVGFNNIIPEAARLAKRGHLTRDGTLYVRVKKKGPEAQSSEPSLDLVRG
jgi:hypothetical protein